MKHSLPKRVGKDSLQKLKDFIETVDSEGRMIKKRSNFVWSFVYEKTIYEGNEASQELKLSDYYDMSESPLKIGDIVIVLNAYGMITLTYQRTLDIPCFVMIPKILY